VDHNCSKGFEIVNKNKNIRRFEKLTTIVSGLVGTLSSYIVENSDF
jgi:hypothetical protein